MLSETKQRGEAEKEPDEGEHGSDLAWQLRWRGNCRLIGTCEMRRYFTNSRNGSGMIIQGNWSVGIGGTKATVKNNCHT